MAAVIRLRRSSLRSPEAFGATADESTPATASSSSNRRPLSRRQPGQPPSGASAGISQPHFGQTLSALIIIGESLVHTPPLLLRKILPKVTPGLQQLNSEPLYDTISLTYTNVPKVDSGLMNVRDNLCNWCPSLCDLYLFKAA